MCMLAWAQHTGMCSSSRHSNPILPTEKLVFFGLQPRCTSLVNIYLHLTLPTSGTSASTSLCLPLITWFRKSCSTCLSLRLNNSLGVWKHIFPAFLWTARNLPGTETNGCAIPRPQNNSSIGEACGLCQAPTPESLLGSYSPLKLSKALQYRIWSAGRRMRSVY